MFDSHCHLHDARLLRDADALLARARSAGVRGIMLAGVDQGGWRDEHALATRHADVCVSYGLHPQCVAAWDEAETARQLFALEAALSDATLKRPAAIGEIGLDAFTPERRACLDRQARVFTAQLALARARNLPVILHILRAHDEALRLLRDEGLPAAGGVVHSYSGSLAQLDAYLALGLSVSLCGTVTFKNATKALAVARALPRERLLVETDAPDQTPEPHRPGQNEPAFLGDVVRAVARARDESVAEVAAYSEENARRLFSVS